MGIEDETLIFKFQIYDSIAIYFVQLMLFILKVIAFVTQNIHSRMRNTLHENKNFWNLTLIIKPLV